MNPRFRKVSGFIYQQGIVVIVNLSFENSSVAQVIKADWRLF
ncbi:MAG: hypothetical protein ACLTQN_01805 [Blautia massiliensis (ex Durand et al. 2017)]